jgi:feruloyl esterase
MASIGITTANLRRLRAQWPKSFPDVSNDDGRLSRIELRGGNPGNLGMWAYAAEGLPARPALVVVLHGCLQTALGFDRGLGWSILAERHGFIALYPEQKRANNPNLCFNWFNEGDVQRGSGEAASIHAMIQQIVRDHGVDEDRIFITGLSAGGAMANAMLAAYPETFAAGAIIAGLPHGAARGVQEAFQAMAPGAQRTAREWGDRVRDASPHKGPWPRVSVWHGTADAIVAPMNSEQIVQQWLDVHGLAQSAPERRALEPVIQRIWRDAKGAPVVEENLIAGMAHGAPLAIASAADPLGAAGPYLLDVGVASTRLIAQDWGLIGAAEAPAVTRIDTQKSAPRQPRPPRSGAPEVVPLFKSIQSTITDALKSAGLMK